MNSTQPRSSKSTIHFKEEAFWRQRDQTEEPCTAGATVPTQGPALDQDSSANF